MSFQDLPNEIQFEIVKQVAESDIKDVGPLLRSGHGWQTIVYDDDVLKVANIDYICEDPLKICIEGSSRVFFERCLAACNPTAVYYEALRLVIKERDIDGSINLLSTIVECDYNALFACGMLCVSAGYTDYACQLIQHFVKIFEEPTFLEVRNIGQELLRVVEGFNPPNNNSFQYTWKYPKSPEWPYPDYCMDYHFDDTCLKCYVYCVAKRVSLML